MKTILLWLLICLPSLAQDYTFDRSLDDSRRLVTISGNRGKDEADTIRPRIRIVNGNLRIDRVDNAIFESISIENGWLEIVSCRQCQFRSIQVSKSEAKIACLITSTRGDACNNNRFDFVSVRNCDSDCYLRIEGHGSGLGMARDMSFGQIFLHCPWEGSGFRNKQRTMLAIDKCRNLQSDMLAITTDPKFEDGFAIVVGDVADCSFRARVRGEPKRQRINSELNNRWEWVR